MSRFDRKTVTNGISLLQNLRSTLEDLQEEKGFSDEPVRLVDAILDEQQFHFLHHYLPGYCQATDVDFVEVRDGEIAALVEVKVGRAKFSGFGRKIYLKIAKKLEVPVLFVEYLPHEPASVVGNNLFRVTFYHAAPKEDNLKKIPEGITQDDTHYLIPNITVTLDWNEFKEFMKNLSGDSLETHRNLASYYGDRNG